MSRVRCHQLCLLLLLPLVVVAGDFSGSVPGMRDMRFRNYSVMQGLPQATARAIEQDSTGFIWIGTQDGLARFDGYEFKVYRHDRNDPTSLSDNYIRDLVVGSEGDVWVSTQSGGLNQYQARLDRFRHWRAAPGQPHALASDSINALAMGNDQRLWIATERGYLQWIDNGDDRVLDAGLGQQTSLTNLRTLRALPDGSLLAGGLHGLFRIDQQGQSILPLGPSDLDVYAVVPAGDGSTWVGTSVAGLYHLAADGEVLKHYLHQELRADASSLPDNEVRGLVLDRNGLLWIAGNSAGLASLDPGTGIFRHFPHHAADPQSVAANRLWSLHESRDGLLLVGSWANGFSIHDPATEMFGQIYSVPGDPRTLPASPAMSVYGAPDGSLWAGIIDGGGLVQLDLQRGVVRRYVHDGADPDSLANNFVQLVKPAAGGGLWVATSGGGLDHLRADGSGFDHLRHDAGDPASLNSDSILYMLEDKAGTLWVATQDQGLDELCTGCSAFRHHMHVPDDPYSLASNTVSALLETRGGEFWVGTRNGGLARMDRATGRLTRYVTDPSNSNSLSANSISCLFEDSLGHVWVGTHGGALSMVLPGADGSVQFKTIDRSNGLDSDAIGAILEDAAGGIWVSTIRGISHIDQVSGRAVNYSGHDGASQLGYWVNSATRLADGRLVFGGLSGITVFDPRRLPAPQRPTPVITDMLLEGHPFTHVVKPEHALAPGEADAMHPIILRHDQNDISFEFSALQYSSPESIDYEYQLQGHDPDWVPVSWRRRIATYTGLAPGFYALNLRARSGNGQWSGQPSQLNFRIQQPPWRTPLAYAAYALLVLLAVLASGWRVRSNLQRRYEVQETIRDSEARLKRALRGSGTELWDVDLVADRMYRENRMAHIAAGDDPASQTSTGYLPFVHPDDQPSFMRALQAHLKQQTPSFEASYRTLDRNDRWVWLLSRGEVVERDEAGRALRMSGTTSDINALKQAEDALRALNEDLENRVSLRTAELRARNADLARTLQQLTEAQHKLLESEKLAALGGLVAGVAHEINTPVGVAVTAASFLQVEAGRLRQLLDAGNMSNADLQRFAAKARQSCDMILRNLQAASRLVSSFKQVAVAQSSEDMAVLDLRECLQQIMVTLGPMMKKTPHRIELSCPKALMIRTSPGALYQIVTNLVTNSLMHAFRSAAPGRISLQVTHVRGRVQLQYSDDGVGMEAAVLAQMYDPFFTTSRGQGGSGLGMHIVYNLVTQVLEGDIECSSQPGQGTTFVIRFGAPDPLA